MGTTVASGQATNAIRVQGRQAILFAGTLTGTATLTPQMSLDGGTTWDGIADPSNAATALAFTATFPMTMIELPMGLSEEVRVRLASTSGSGSWAVRSAVFNSAS